MELIADILLIGGAIAAALYCFVLSKRLKRFNSLDNGVGGAVAVLSAQVDEMTGALTSAQTSAGQSSDALAKLTQRAEEVATRLELLLASMHDLPTPATDTVLSENAEVKSEGQSPVATEETPVMTEDDSAMEPVFASRASKSEDTSLFRSHRNEAGGLAA